MTPTEAPTTAPRPKTARSAKAVKEGKAPAPTKAFEVLDALKAASRDKEIDLPRLCAALEEAIATAARKVYKVREITARFDPKSGELTAWTPYRIVEQKTKAEVPPPALDPDDIPIGQLAARPVAPAVEPEKEIRLPYVELLPEEVPALLSGELSGKSWIVVTDPDGEERPVSLDEARPGDEIRLFRSTEGLGRIAAQSAKQVLYQKVREAERDNVYNEYLPKLGELITGTVKRFERGDMIVDLGRTEAVIPRDHQSRAERYTQGERVRGVLFDVHRNPKGSQIVLSRTAPELLIRLMERDVPEISDGTVIIRGCVRQPGDRAKVAVSSRDRDVDAVGACVGMRGSRVQNIMRELRGERIDIIQYSEDLITYAMNALSPAKITRVSLMPAEDGEVGEDGEAPPPTLECIVEEDQLSMAIGKRGQNVRLASALIGAKIEIKSEQAVKAEVAEALQRMLLQSQRRASLLDEVPGLTQAAYDALTAAGLTTVGELLEAADDEPGGERAAQLAAAGLEETERESAVDAARDYETAPPEPEYEDEDEDEPDADAEAGEDPDAGPAEEEIEDENAGDGDASGPATEASEK